MNRSPTDPSRNRVRWPREARETHEEAQRRLVAQTRAIEQPRADAAWARYLAQPIGEKTCKDCRLTKPISEFYICGGKPQSYCKRCDNARRSNVSASIKAGRWRRLEALKARRA